MTLKNNGASRLYYVKRCASSQIHRRIQTGITVWKRSSRVKIGDFFVPRDLVIWWMTLANNRAPLLHYVKLYASLQIHRWIQTWVIVGKRSTRVIISDFFPCDLEVWWMTTKNNRAALLYYVKLCASFENHGWIQTGVTLRKRPIWVKIDDFWSLVTLKFDGWPWKTIGHLSYITSSFVQHFLTICEFNLELQSENG